MKEKQGVLFLYINNPLPRCRTTTRLYLYLEFEEPDSCAYFSLFVKQEEPPFGGLLRAIALKKSWSYAFNLICHYPNFLPFSTFFPFRSINPVSSIVLIMITVGIC